MSTSRLVPDDDMTASSQLDTEYAPLGGRLNYQTHFDSQGSITQIGGWSASTNDLNQWLQIKFSQIYQITGVATQGMADNAQWVKTYKLEYSSDGSTWTDYPDVRGLILLCLTIIATIKILLTVSTFGLLFMLNRNEKRNNS